MQLQTLPDEKLQVRLERLVRHERKVMALVIEHIAEVMRRKLFLTLGYHSIYHYLTKKFHYSEGCAYRRMWAAQALLQVPEIKPRLEEGSLNLTQVCLVQQTLRKEEKIQCAKIPVEKRKEIYAQIAGKTGRESEKILDREVSVELPRQVAVEKHRRDHSVELTLQVSPELFAKLQTVKNLYSHIDPGADWVRTLELMTDDVIKKRDPLARKRPAQKIPVEKTVTQSFAKTKKPSVKRRPIPSVVKRYILRRDEGKCQYVGPTGRKCESRHQIELDHIRPVQRGGGNEAENLRVLCRRHNDFRVGAPIRRD